MAIIGLGKINKKILYAFVGGLFKLLPEIILDNIEEQKMKSHPFILGLNAGLGMLFAIIPLIYFNKTIKKLSMSQHQSQEHSLSENRELIYVEKIDYSQKEKNSKTLLIILVIAFLDLGQKLLSFLDSESYDNFWMFDSLFIIIFSYFILKTKLYKHHLLSLIVIIISGIILNIFKFVKSFKLGPFFTTVIIEIIYSLEIVLSKYAMEKNFCSPFRIAFYQGLVVFIMNLLLLLIFSFIPIEGTKIKYNNETYVDNLMEYFSNFKGIEILIFLLAMIGRAGFMMFGLLTIQYFTSGHIILVLIIGEIFHYFRYENTDSTLYVKYPILILIIFFSLILLEIIELNFCGFQINTEKNISKRAETEDTLSNNDNESIGNELELPTL